MNINNRWVHLEDVIELEIFLTICEEQGISWNCGKDARNYLDTDLAFYKFSMEKAKDFDIEEDHTYGYYTDGERLYDVELIGGESFCAHEGFEDTNRFDLEG
jgi:hypothetical protein